MGHLKSDRSTAGGFPYPRLTLPGRTGSRPFSGTPDDAILDYGVPPASAELRGARLSQGLTLDQASERYRIPIEHIHGMERADLSGLPGQAYLDGFIRSYAKQLDAERIHGHDPEWYVRQLKQEFARSEYFVRPSGALESPGDDRLRVGLIRSAIVAACLLLAVSAAFGAWYAYEAVQYVEIIDAAPGDRPAASPIAAFADGR